MASGLKMVAVLLVVTCLLVAGVRAMPPVKRNVSRLCGPALVQALHIVCNGIYQNMWKKNTQYGILGSEFPAGAEENVAENSVTGISEGMSLFPFLVQKSRMPLEERLLQTGLRVRRGVSDECCHRGCSIDMLRLYCAEP